MLNQGQRRNYAHSRDLSSVMVWWLLSGFNFKSPFLPRQFPREIPMDRPSTLQRRCQGSPVVNAQRYRASKAKKSGRSLHPTLLPHDHHWS
jgi:hypothetical protein